MLQAQRRALAEVEEAALEAGRREAEEKRAAQRAARLAERRAQDEEARRRAVAAELAQAERVEAANTALLEQRAREIQAMKEEN